jgi:2-polyprenyl-6-methoxyphenol hydroxylase-like FAD-dependent oxidoreductase
MPNASECGQAGAATVADGAPLTESIVPVLIVGGGPAGLALAIELGLASIPCTLIESRDGQATIPRMSALFPRSMELNRRWGIAEEVKSVGWPRDLPLDVAYCTSLTGYELARVRRPPYSASQKTTSTPEPGCGCAQIFYDPILLRRARSLPSVTIRHYTTLVSFEQDDTCVRAQVVDAKTGRGEVIVAKYMVGCDGSASTVASLLGTAYSGRGVISNSINIYFSSDEIMKIHNLGWAKFYRFADPQGNWGELIGIDGRNLWRLTVLEADPKWDTAGYMRRLSGVDFHYDIISVMKWERLERWADQFGSGRVFIAGDSAHACSPTGGLGLHSGLQDAVDLGWKLSAVLQGWGGASLLKSYEIERKPISIINAEVSSEEYDIWVALPTGPEIVSDSPEGAAYREYFLDFFNRTAGERVSRLTENLHLGYCYESSPICVSDGTPPIPIETPRFVPSARPGTRAPHAWIGNGRSTLDLFGRSFVLLRLGADPPDASSLRGAAAKRGVPFDIVDLADPEIAALYEKRFVLVRPDGHVAWRNDEMPRDPLALVDHVRGAAQMNAFPK